MNNNFPCAHPNVNVFVETLEEEGRWQEKWSEDIRNGHDISENCSEDATPKFPLEFLEYRDECFAKKREKDKKEKSKKEKNAKAKVKKETKHEAKRQFACFNWFCALIKIMEHNRNKSEYVLIFFISILFCP